MNKIISLHEYNEIQRKNNQSFPEFEAKLIYDKSGIPIPGFKAITNTNTNKTQSIMSKNYEIFNHEQAFDIIDKIVHSYDQEVKPTTRFDKDGAVMKVSYNLGPQHNIEVLEGDALRTRLIGFNSVDGSKCLTFGIEFERLTCLNGMSGYVREFQFARKHTSLITKEENLQYDIAAKVAAALVTVKENAHMLKNTPIDYTKGMTLIKKMIDHKVIPQKLEGWIEDFWNGSSSNKHSTSIENGADMWSLYNSISSAITHSTNKSGKRMADMVQDNIGERATRFILKVAKQAS